MVVGAGVIGAAVALALSTAGLTVTVLDPEPSAGASSGNAGMVVPSYCLPPPTGAELRHTLLLLGRGGSGVALRAPLRPSTLAFLGRLLLASRQRGSLASARQLHEMAERSVVLYEQLAEQDVAQLDQRGWLWVCAEETSWQALGRRADRLTRLGVQVQRLSGEDVMHREPLLVGSARGGLFFPGDVATDPRQLHRGLIVAAQARGARFLGHAAVGPLRRDGRLAGVVSTVGPVEARHVVLAAGAATGRLGRAFGLRLPIEPGYGWSLTLPAAVPLAGPLQLVDEHIVVTPRVDSVRLTSGMELGGPRQGPADPGALRRLRAAAEQWLPTLRDLGAGEAWRGARPLTASGLPIIRTSWRDPHLHVAAGHGTLGVTLAAVTAELVTQLIADADAREAVRSR